MDGELLERQYRNHLSGYLKWESLPHAGDWLLFEKNIGAYVGIDEVCLSRGELYTILINKEKTGRSGSIIANCKRYRCKECHLRIAPSLPAQTVSGKGNHYGYGS